MKHPILIALTMASVASIQSAWADDQAASACPLEPVRAAAQIAAEIDSTGHSSPLLEFRRGTAELTGRSERQLAEMARMLHDDSGLRIEVGFIANEREDGAVAETLARERGKVVRRKLLSFDASATQVATRSYSREPTVAAADFEFAANPQRQCQQADAPVQTSAAVFVTGS